MNKPVLNYFYVKSRFSIWLGRASVGVKYSTKNRCCVASIATQTLQKHYI